MDYSKRVKIPNPDAINGGLNYPRAVQLVEKFGMPRANLTDDCMPVTNPKLKALMTPKAVDVGNFNVTGLQKAAESLTRIFAKVKKDKPELYSQISTAGMLCCRRIRGSNKTPSNHAFGSAIDLKINGRLDDRADAMCQIGLLELYPYFHNEGWFWGAEYKGPYEDAMHWDVAWETMRKWYK